MCEPTNKKRKVEETQQGHYKDMGYELTNAFEDTQQHFLTHTALSYRDNKDEELGSYVTDSCGMFMHKMKLMRAIINEDMEVEFQFVRELNEEEVAAIENMNDLFPKAIIK